MSGKQIAGQLFLWAGFISAALAATCQREFDFLADDEQTVLNTLPAKLVLNRDELASTTTKKIGELTLVELEETIGAVTLISDRNIADAEAAQAEAKRREEAGEPALEPDPAALEKEKIKTVSLADFEKGRTGNLENKWQTVQWLWYGLSMAVGLVGVVLLRSTAKSADQEEGKVAEQYATITSSLDVLNEKVSLLQRELGSMTPQSVVSFIDDECAPAFGEFADSRNALIQRFGMQPYAEVMTQFASAERFINRSWSASADGYMNEVRDCVARADAHLTEAQRLIGEFEKGK